MYTLHAYIPMFSFSILGSWVEVMLDVFFIKVELTIKPNCSTFSSKLSPTNVSYYAFNEKMNTK